MLSGCSGGPIIDIYAADYRVTEASAGDAQLLLNILRAKDDIPIHFADLSVIHGTLQMTAGASATIPIAQNGGMTATTISPSLSGQSAPTFDVGTLDTQEFTRGMLAPVDVNIIRQLFNQGIDPRLIMLLFFSEYRTPYGQRFLNTTACDRADPGRYPERGCYSQIYKYLAEMNGRFAGRQVKANVYYGWKPVSGWMAGAWTLTNLTDLRQMDPAKQRMIDKRLYAITDPRLIICYEKPDHSLKPLFEARGGPEACTKNEVTVPQVERASGLYVRSAYEVLQYLGQVLRFQEEREPNRCITLGGDPTDPTRGRCDIGEVLFQVNSPVGTPVIGTRYSGGWYALYDRSCNKHLNEKCDYSLQVLAILELLLNANKSAKDIIAIPRVQVVQ
jgi:hypothetical protein